MTVYDYTETKMQAEEREAEIRAEFPEYFDEAKAFMSKILRPADRQKWLVFHGEAYDRYNDLWELGTTLWYITVLHKCRAEGKPVTDIFMTGVILRSHGLGFAVIEGGKKD